MLAAVSIQTRVLGPATVKWNDYVGTAAADDTTAVLGNPSLYELADIDRERWTIAGVDVDIVDRVVSVTVYAFDRIAGALESAESVGAVGQVRGELVVRPFPVASEQVQDFLNEAFRQLSIRLAASPFRDHVLVVQAAT